MEEKQIDLADYLTVVRVRKWTIILTVLIVMGAIVALSLSRTPLYRAEARVLVEPIAGEAATFNPAVPVDVQTQAEVIASESVAVLVAEELELKQGIDSLLNGLTVTVQGETQVVNISYTSPDPELAQAVAQAFAESYIDFRREQALEDVVSEEESLTEQIESVTDQLSGVTEDLTAAQTSRDDALAASLETQRSILISRLGVLQQQLDDARSQRSQSADGGQVIAPAVLPRSPSSPNHVRSGILGLLLGGVLGLGLAFFRERLDNRFRTRSDLEHALEAPVLATVPRYPSPKKGESPLVSVSEASVGAAEAYRSLRTNLQFITSQRDLRSVLITSPSEKEGKSATTANLGVLLAQAGRRVILMSSDLRRPTLGGYFGLVEGDDTEPGLSTWLSSADAEPWDVIRDPGIPNLRVIPSGPLPPNPAELLTSPRLTALVRMLEANSDLVLCDSPPVLAVADAAELASVMQGSVLVVNAASTHKSATIHARQELERVGGKLIGAVLNGHEPSTSPYHYSTYSSYSAASARSGRNGSDDGAAKKRRFFSRR